jgi:hypothetical protein
MKVIEIYHYAIMPGLKKDAEENFKIRRQAKYFLTSTRLFTQSFYLL